MSTTDDNPLSITDPLGRTTTYTYDSNKNLLTMTDPLNETWTYTYDSNGFQVSAKDPLEASILAPILPSLAMLAR